MASDAIGNDQGKSAPLRCHVCAGQEVKRKWVGLQQKR